MEKREAQILTENYAGHLVWIPESRLEEFTKRQEELKAKVARGEEILTPEIREKAREAVKEMMEKLMKGAESGK